ncbi:MAG: putative lipid-binding transport protein (Tim44 family) [Candidatus Aldehydirespiratoraceae bacterium]
MDVASSHASTPPVGSSTAAPPLIARVLAVLAILVGGLCGGLIGFAVTDISCTDGCTGTASIAGLASAIGCAVGVAVVAVLALRAMAEWNAKEVRDQAHRPKDT